MTRLFISYRRANWSFTYWLAEELAKLLDAEIFVDYSGIDETDFERSLLRHLRESDAVILVVSEQTFEPRIHNDRDWVRREIREALIADKPIALAMVNGLVPPPDIPDDIQAIRGKQGIEFYPRFFKVGVQEMAAFIERATPVKLRQPIAIVPAISTTAAQAPKSHKTRLDDAISLFEAGQYDQSIATFEALIAEHYAPRWVSLPELRDRAIQERDLEQRRWAAGEVYDELISAFRIMPDKVAAAYDQFQADYPEFSDDPAGLRGKIATWQTAEAARHKATPPAQGAHERPTVQISQPFPVPAVSGLTPQQQRLLDLMLDMNRPPKAREAAGQQINLIGDPRPGVGLRSDDLPDIAWCDVPGGEFTMGARSERDNPVRTVNLPTFYIATYPVTYRQFQAFIDASDGYRNTDWWRGLHADGLNQQKRGAADQHWKFDNHPRENVSWYEAMAFGRWLSAKLGYEITLPTEEQWEKAARGTDGRDYPYPGPFDSAKGNTHETGIGQTSAVGIFTTGESPHHVLDMSGNVWEWCLDEYQSRKINIGSNERRNLRGGSWLINQNIARAVYRNFFIPDFRNNYYGFRLVCGVRPPSL